MSSCVTVCMKTCFNTYTSYFSEMTIYSLLFIIVCIISISVFVCMFWYTFTLHDFGQNDWEERPEKYVYKSNKVDSKTDDTSNNKMEKDTEDKKSIEEKNINICEVIVERPFSGKKIMFENDEKINDSDEKESDSGVGYDSPDTINTPETHMIEEECDNEEEDVQIDELFITRSKSAFSRASIDDMMDDIVIGEKEEMVKTWIKEVKQKLKREEINDWWKEIGVESLKKEGMTEEDIKAYWESKRWYWSNNDIMMEMVAGKIWELKNQSKTKFEDQEMKTLHVEDVNSDSL